MPRNSRGLKPEPGGGGCGSVQTIDCRSCSEGVGFGLLGQAIEELPGETLPPSQARKHLAELVLRSEPAALDVPIDESLHSGTVALFEVTTIPLIGPNLFVVPAADPSDKLLDICFATASPKERQCLSEWLTKAVTRGLVPLSTLVAARVSITGWFRRGRVDDDVSLIDAGDNRPIKFASKKEQRRLVVPGSVR
jgi:hypothetical protein